MRGRSAPSTRATLLNEVRRRGKGGAAARREEAGGIARGDTARRRHGACHSSIVLYLMREQDRLGHLAHRLTRIHAELLDAPESIRFFEALAVHEQALGALHDLARFQRLFQRAHLLAQGPELREAG